MTLDPSNAQAPLVPVHEMSKKKKELKGKINAPFYTLLQADRQVNSCYYCTSPSHVNPFKRQQSKLFIDSRTKLSLAFGM